MSMIGATVVAAVVVVAAACVGARASAGVGEYACECTCDFDGVDGVDDGDRGRVWSFSAMLGVKMTVMVCSPADINVRKPGQRVRVRYCVSE